MGRCEQRTTKNPNTRYRLVAGISGEKDWADHFESTPPLEAEKVLLSIEATRKSSARADRSSCSSTGPDGVVFVVLLGSPQGTCNRLQRWLYGVRQAANAWERRDFVEKLAEIGMMSGNTSQVIFQDPETGVRPVVHGDDFTFLGFETELQQVKRELRRSYQVKVSHPGRRRERREDGGHPQPQVVHGPGCGLESTSKGLDTLSIREDSGNHNENDECLWVGVEQAHKMDLISTFLLKKPSNIALREIVRPTNQWK